MSSPFNANRRGCGVPPPSSEVCAGASGVFSLRRTNSGAAFARKFDADLLIRSPAGLPDHGPRVHDVGFRIEAPSGHDGKMAGAGRRVSGKGTGQGCPAARRTCGHAASSVMPSQCQRLSQLRAQASVRAGEAQPRAPARTVEGGKPRPFWVWTRHENFAPPPLGSPCRTSRGAVSVSSLSRAAWSVRLPRDHVRCRSAASLSSSASTLRSTSCRSFSMAARRSASRRMPSRVLGAACTR